MASDPFLPASEIRARIIKLERTTTQLLSQRKNARQYLNSDDKRLLQQIHHELLELRKKVD